MHTCPRDLPLQGPIIHFHNQGPIVVDTHSFTLNCLESGDNPHPAVQGGRKHPPAFQDRIEIPAYERAIILFEPLQQSPDKHDPVNITTGIFLERCGTGAQYRWQHVKFNIGIYPDPDNHKVHRIHLGIHFCQYPADLFLMYDNIIGPFYLCCNPHTSQCFGY